MKRIFSILSLSSFLLITSNHAVAGDRYKSYYEDTARVVHVEPIYRQTNYRSRDCDRGYSNGNRNDYQKRYFSEQTSTITGAVIGGVIGNQFGDGRGKTAMTIAGTVLGGSVAKDRYRNKPLGHPRDNRNYRDQCRNSNEWSGYRNTRNIEGYHVTYRYNGQTFTTTMAHEPGNRIPIEVSIRPKNNRYNDAW